MDFLSSFFNRVIYTFNWSGLGWILGLLLVVIAYVLLRLRWYWTLVYAAIGLIAGIVLFLALYIVAVIIQSFAVGAFVIVTVRYAMFFSLVIGALIGIRRDRTRLRQVRGI